MDRNDLENRAAENRRLLGDPVFMRAFNETRNEIIARIETADLTKDTDSALEEVRALQALLKIKRTMFLTIAHDDMKKRTEDKDGKR